MLPRRERFALGIAACFLLLLLASGAGGAFLLRSGRMPTFFKAFWLPNRHALVFSNGPVCPANRSRAACDTGLVDRTFTVIYWQPEESRVLVAVQQK